MQIFSEWLERLKRGIDFDDEGWLLKVAVEQIKRTAPKTDWDESLAGGVRESSSHTGSKTNGAMTTAGYTSRRRSTGTC